MRTKFHITVLSVLLVVAPSPCFALRYISYVSKERAKEMGIDVRSKANGPKQVWVEQEFRTKGDLKYFSHVELEIKEGNRLLVGYAALREERMDSGSVVVRFLADRIYLENVTLSMVVGPDPENRTGYELRVKDFVEPEKPR